MFDRIREWLSSTESEETYDEYDQYNLYELGKTLCEHYPGGMPGHRNGPSPGSGKPTHFGEESMEQVLRSEYRDVDQITIQDIEHLDRLLKESEESSFDAKRNGEIDRDKVIKFRRLFFEKFSEDEIRDRLDHIYMLSKDRFGLEQITQNKPSDSYVYEFQVETNRPNPAIDTGELEIQEPEYERRQVEMKRVATCLNISLNPITDRVDEFVDEQAKLFWDKFDVSDTDGTDYEDQLIDAMCELEQDYYTPNQVVLNGDVFDEKPTDLLDSMRVFFDETGVMDVPFVVVSSTMTPIRVSMQDVTFEPGTISEPNRYNVSWFGNYAIVDEDAVTGPVKQ